MEFKEIEALLKDFKTCPKCGKTEGFWAGSKGDNVFVHCKHCGAKFEFHEIYGANEKGGTPTYKKLLRT